MQLEGELTTTYEKTYSKNIASARLIIKSDGLTALWRGLSAGVAYQIVMNGTRLTIFDQLKESFDINPILGGMIAGGIAGGMGSPLYMMKTQQQALSSINVGNQHTGEFYAMILLFIANII